MGSAAERKRMVSVMESNKPSSLSPQASFVSCLSCHYCDCVSFDETDVTTYTAHLKEAHSITRNVESLVALTLKEQQSRAEVVTPPAVLTAVVKPPVFNLPTTEMTLDWMDDDVGGAMEDEEPEEERRRAKEEKSNIPAVTAVVQPPSFNLPTTEMTMDWMDDDVGGMMEDEEPEEEKKESEEKKSNVPGTEKITKDDV